MEATSIPSLFNTSTSIEKRTEEKIKRVLAFLMGPHKSVSGTELKWKERIKEF